MKWWMALIRDVVDSYLAWRRNKARRTALKKQRVELDKAAQKRREAEYRRLTRGG